MSTVINLAARSARVQRPIQGGGDEGVAIWSLADLVPKTPTAWLKDMVRDREYEAVALSLWQHQPNLRQATERLGAFLTPLWPDSDGKPLWAATVETAIRKVEAAIQRGEGYEGRVVGIYLYWLSQCVADVARIEVYGVNKDGARFRWTPFEAPLHEWAKKNGMTHLEACLAEETPRNEFVAGLKTHLVARISNPVDTGYLEMYAPRG